MLHFVEFETIPTSHFPLSRCLSLTKTIYVHRDTEKEFLFPSKRSLSVAERASHGGHNSTPKEIWVAHQSAIRRQLEGLRPDTTNGGILWEFWWEFKQSEWMECVKKLPGPQNRSLRTHEVDFDALMVKMGAISSILRPWWRETRSFRWNWVPETEALPTNHRILQIFALKTHKQSHTQPINRHFTRKFFFFRFIEDIRLMEFKIFLVPDIYCSAHT